MSQPSHSFDASDPLALAAEVGEMGERIRSFDWSSTPLGPPSSWPTSLKTSIRIMLASRYPMFVWWGPQLINFYNDGYIPVLGTKHPEALGRPASEIWSEIWPVVGPLAESVLREGRATWDRELLLIMERDRFFEETYFTFSYSPLPDDDGRINGVFCACSEDTGHVIGQRRLRTLRALAEQSGTAHSIHRACERAVATLAGNPHDLPFALLYLQEAQSDRFELAGACGFEPGETASPLKVPLASGDEAVWPFGDAAASGRPALVDIAENQLGPLPCPVWPEPPRQAIILPLTRPGRERPAGFVVIGLSPRLRFDEDYRAFAEMIAGHIATAIANARAYEEEKRRAEDLAELDQAKTTFFSNVSHEFRTPLALMLGPLDDLLAQPEQELDPETRLQLRLVHRNGLRLLRLVNSLLDFSRIEAGRASARFQPTDLGDLTTDLASMFRAAVERARLRLRIDCPPQQPPVYVDREMWEKIVLNLLSNAFKFTFEGEISISLRHREQDRETELVVRDTGSGIPAEEMPRLFERFHRIRNARGRTHEGSGIGLALVHELVKLHGGSISAASEVGKGTAFTIRIPLGSAHLPSRQVITEPITASATPAAQPYVEEALRWIHEEALDDQLAPQFPGHSLARLAASPDADDRPLVVVADDNADMRQYIARLLSSSYKVETVPDGAAALAVAKSRMPDLILSDVMMPQLNGFELLDRLRADHHTQGIPIILLSARAGEESRVEGMKSGADDYLIKPFSARELLASVEARLEIARIRSRADAQREELLMKSREQSSFLQSLVDNSPISIAVVEGERLRFTMANPACQALAGSNDRLIGRTLEEAFPEVAQTGLANLLRQVLDSAEAAHIHDFKTSVPGRTEVTWWECQLIPLKKSRGAARSALILAWDITERKQVEKALHESEQRFRAMANAAPAVLWVTEPDQHCSFISRSWLEFTGQCEEKALGDGWMQAIHPEDRQETERRFRQATEKRKTFSLDYRLRRADGRYRWVSDTGRPRFGAQGDFLGFIGSVTDIHERKRSVEELHEAHRRKDEFLATLAHELRNPLAPLRNGLQLLKQAGAQPDVLAQAQSMMERQLKQMVRLIDDLLDLSRISRGRIPLRMETVELCGIARDAIEASESSLRERQHALTVDLPEEPIHVEADPARLVQVIANLLNNAGKFTSEGGEIQLAVESREGEAWIRVKDNGIGIPPDRLPTVFEMFSQVDQSLERENGGLGIGLSLVKGVVEMHGGSVEAASEGEGRGSEFTVRLPLAQPPASSPALPPDSSPSWSGAPLRILVVDDNADAARTMALMLNLQGNETRLAHDGLEAISVAEVFRPDIALLDIGMPKLNGYDAARRIRQEPWGKDMALVALTGWGQENDRRQSAEAGFDRHIVKPVDPNDLLALLQELGPSSRSRA